MWRKKRTRVAVDNTEYINKCMLFIDHENLKKNELFFLSIKKNSSSLKRKIVENLKVYEFFFYSFFFLFFESFSV